MPVRAANLRRRRLLLVALVPLLGGAGRAQVEPRAAEHQVKAALLFKFLNFIEWPAQGFERPDSPLVIGVIGANPLAAELALVVNDRTAQGHPVAMRRVRPGDPLTGLHMVFVGRADSARVAAVLDATRGQSILVVTESDEGFARGSAINFVVDEERVRFDVALRAAEQSRLRISSRLLAVARRVLASSS